jgi:hypothetical protein
MTRVMRNTTVILGAFLLGACVLASIQQTEPVRTLSFKGSHTAMAQCVQARLGGKIHSEAFGGRHIIYNDVKGMEKEGLTQYAITIETTGPGEGFAAWRIRKAETSEIRLSNTAVRRLWGPVEACAARLKP